MDVEHFYVAAGLGEYLRVADKSKGCQDKTHTKLALELWRGMRICSLARSS